MKYENRDIIPPIQLKIKLLTSPCSNTPDLHISHMQKSVSYNKAHIMC